MATLTELGGACGQQILVGRRVGCMAPGAFPFFYKWVHKSPAENLLKSFMTFQAYLPFGTWYELKFTLWVSRFDNN